MLCGVGQHHGHLLGGVESRTAADAYDQRCVEKAHALSSAAASTLAPRSAPPAARRARS